MEAPLVSEGGAPSPALSEAALVEKTRLHKGLSPFAVLMLTLSCLSPVLSVYGIGSDVLLHAGTGALPLFLIGIACALVWGLVYSELGSAFPFAGGDYLGVGAVLGPWAGAVTLAIWAATMGPTAAFQCQTVAVYVGQLLPSVSPMIVTFSAMAASLVVALLALRASTFVTGTFLAIEMAAVIVLAAAGFLHPVRGGALLLHHPMALGTSGALVPVSLAVLAGALVNTTYGTVGGNQAIYFGEELRDPHRRMGGVILWAALIGGLGTALPVIAVVISARDLPHILASAAPFATFIGEALGPWAATALSAGVALAIFNANIVLLMVAGRLYFSLGRDRLVPGVSGLLTRVEGKSGVPRVATLAAGVFASACCFLSSHILLVFISGLIVYGWALVCLAVLVGRARGLTGKPGHWRSPLHPLGPVLGLLMAAGFAISDLYDADAGRPSLILLGLVVLAAVAWNYFVLRPRGWKPSLADVTSASN